MTTTRSDLPRQSLLDLPAISGCYLFPQKRYVADPYFVKVNDNSIMAVNYDEYFRTIGEFMHRIQKG